VSDVGASTSGHSHVFLGAGHEKNERRTWAVIWLCGMMMVAEIVGGLLFGSIALIADGLHMSTHASALLLAALAYSYARQHAEDPRFTFGTGKFGDLAGFTSAVILAMIAALIGYEAASRFLEPVPIHFAEAIPIACLGLAVNIASALLLSGGDHHAHSHGHAHGNAGADRGGEARRVETAGGSIVVEIFERGVPPRFRLRAEAGASLDPQAIVLETVRPNGARHLFAMRDRGAYLESVEEIPEPRAFATLLQIAGEEYSVHRR
jgi:cation diffusion facilitator family transporter